MPAWFHALAVASLATALLRAVIIAGDIVAGRRQPMAVMNVVWARAEFATTEVGDRRN